MSFQEQPDRFGRTFAISIGLWGGLALAVWFVLAHVLPPPYDAEKAMRDADARARATKLADDAQDHAIVAIPSACRLASSDPRSILRAYLDGAELDATPKAPPPNVDAQLRTRGAELFAR